MRDRGSVAAGIRSRTSPLGQGVFSYRHPNRQRFLETWGSDVGTPTIYPWRPRVPQVPMTARLMPAPNLPADIAVLPPMPEVRARRGLRVVSVADLLVDGDMITDRERSFRAPLHALFWVPMFVATVFSYEPFPKVEHMERITRGRTVFRRESWRISVGDRPTDPAAVAGWARDHGLPRRLFVRMPDERKPTYLDVESPVLARVFCRQIRRRADAPDELLPRPRCCRRPRPAGSSSTASATRASFGSRPSISPAAGTPRSSSNEVPVTPNRTDGLCTRAFAVARFERMPVEPCDCVAGEVVTLRFGCSSRRTSAKTRAGPADVGADGNSLVLLRVAATMLAEVI